jgi:hypothetical protein
MYKTDNQLSIHFVTSSNSIWYLSQAIKSYIHLCSKSSSLNFYVYALDKSSVKKVKRLSASIECTWVGNHSGSMGHAYGLEKAIENFDVDNCNIVSDTDVMMLRENWDFDLLTVLNDEKLDILGTQHEKIGGFISGNLVLQQYKQLPSTTWFAVRKGLSLPSLDLRPDKEMPMDINSLHLSQLYNLPIGYKLFKDTGWRIPSYLHSRKLTSQVLDLVKPTDENSQVLKGENPYHDEFHLKGSPFLAHQRGSMSHVYRIDKLSRGFYNACDKYLSFPAWSEPARIKDYPLFLVKKIKKVARRIKLSLLSHQ